MSRPETVGRGLNRPMISLSVMAATVMQVLDTTIANVALPHMQGSLSATQDQISWVLTSYIVAAAIMTPPTGWLAGRFGRKRLFALAVVGFTVTSMLCGLAQTLDEMILFRLMQGVFGASLVPLSQSTLLDSFPPAQHGRAMALWGVGVMVGPILGPTLGGWLTENWNWRWVFYINLPFGVLSLLGILAFLPETAIDRTRRLDWFGFGMLSLAIGALQMMLDRGELKDWFGSREIVIEAAIAGAAFYFFLAHSATAARPFLTPAMFRDRNLVTGISIMFVAGIILLSTLALLPPYLQSLMDYPVLTTGFVLAPRGIGTLMSMLIVGRMVGRVDTRLLILSGVSLLVLSMWMMTRWNLDISTASIVWTGLIQGFGLGLLFPPLSTVTFITLDPKLRTEAAGMFSLMRNIGSSIGISIVEALLTRSIQVNHAVLGEHVTQFSPNVRAMAMSGATVLRTGLAGLDAEINRQASTIGYLNDFRLIMWLSAAIVPLVLLLRTRAAKPAAAGAATAMD